MPCKSCGSQEIVCGDDDFPVCSNCGTVQDLNNFQHHLGGISGPQGTYIHLGTAGCGTNYSCRERRYFNCINIIDDITYRLNFTNARKEEVKRMIHQVTQGEFGTGDWFPVLVGACCYVAMRISRKPFLITEVVASIDCDLCELGQMVSRVVKFLGLQLPEFDIVGLLERTIKSFSHFSEFDVDKLGLMVKQGNFVLQCAINWSLTTGRRVGPMVAAVLIFVAELNGIKLKMEDVASELGVRVSTCKTRHTELLGALVKVGQKLPWGKDVNVKNIMKNAKFVIQYMERKSMANTGSKRKRVEDKDVRHEMDFDKECFTSKAGYGMEGIGRNDSQYCTKVQNQNDNLRNEVENLSPEILAKLYQKLKTDVAAIPDGGRNLAGERSSHVSELELYDWWSGRSDLCKKLSLEQIWEKDVGLDALPPSYIRCRLAVQRRREKIKAAKMRIEKIVSPLGERQRVCLPKSDGSGRKRRKRQDVDIDWEDFIIETLLLHEVEEEEIEKGHYKNLLDTHVFCPRVC